MASNRCFGCFSRYFIFIINIILTIIGIVAAVLTGKYLFTSSFWTQWGSGSLTALIIIAFVCIFACSISGICLFFIKSKVIDWVYFGFVMLTFVFEIVVQVYTMSMSFNAMIQIENNWYSSSFNASRRNYEERFSCCGFDSWNISDCAYSPSNTSTENETCGAKMFMGLNRLFEDIEIFIVFLEIFQFILVAFASYMSFLYDPELEKFPPINATA